MRIKHVLFAIFVIFIFCILVDKFRWNAQIQRSRRVAADIHALDVRLEAYRSRNGSFPTTSAGNETIRRRRLKITLKRFRNSQAFERSALNIYSRFLISSAPTMQGVKGFLFFKARRSSADCIPLLRNTAHAQTRLPKLAMC